MLDVAKDAMGDRLRQGFVAIANQPSSENAFILSSSTC